MSAIFGSKTLLHKTFCVLRISCWASRENIFSYNVETCFNKPEHFPEVQGAVETLADLELEGGPLSSAHSYLFLFVVMLDSGFSLVTLFLYLVIELLFPSLSLNSVINIFLQFSIKGLIFRLT